MSKLLLDSTLSPIIMAVETHSKWKETNIGGTPFPLPWLWEEGYPFTCFLDTATCKGPSCQKISTQRRHNQTSTSMDPWDWDFHQHFFPNPSWVQGFPENLVVERRLKHKPKTTTSTVWNILQVTCRISSPSPPNQMCFHLINGPIYMLFVHLLHQLLPPKKLTINPVYWWLIPPKKTSLSLGLHQLNITCCSEDLIILPKPISFESNPNKNPAVGPTCHNGATHLRGGLVEITCHGTPQPLPGILMDSAPLFGKPRVWEEKGIGISNINIYIHLKIDR